jgi:hypothetical protein
VSLVAPSDSPLLRDIQRLLRAPLEQVAVAGFQAPSLDPLTAGPRPARDRARHVRSAGSARRGRRNPRHGRADARAVFAR